jgi:4-amino-4-deoxy-L-arabinose transferase-like glycosyltransferase
LPDEGRYVGVAWNMLAGGDYLVPRLDGLPFFHKPPLFYWITATSLKLFGVNEWAGRLCSAAAGTLMVAMFFWWLKRYTTNRMAILAALILASQPLLFGGAHYANLDMLVAAMISATILMGSAAALQYERQQAYRRFLFAAYGFAALGFLAKGLIGFVLPGGVLFFWLLGRRQYLTMWKMLWWPGIVFFLVLALPWVVLMQQRYPGFLDYYFVYQQFQRAVATGFNNVRPFWFYIPVLLVLTLPWSAQYWRFFKKTAWMPDDHATGSDGRASIRGLMAIWLAVVVVFFSLPASKLVGYVLPALPPMAFFVAEIFDRRLGGPLRVRALSNFAWSLGIAIALCLAAVVAIMLADLRSTRQLAMELKPLYQHNDDIVILGRFPYDLGFYLQAARPPLVVADWDDPELPESDNWLTELYDAGRFEPARAAQLHVRPRDLTSTLCQAQGTDRWLIGDRRSAGAYPFLHDRAPLLQTGSLRAWRLRADEAFSFCGGTPKTGPE